MNISLHHLKMVLSANCTVNQVKADVQRGSRYAWACGCIAEGDDENAMAARFCVPHHVVFIGSAKFSDRSVVLQVPD